VQSAYGTGSFQSRLEADGIESKCKTQGPNATSGLFGKDRFTINLIEGIGTCPAGITVSIRHRADGSRTANFAHSCTSCALGAECTKAVDGRSITVGPDGTRPPKRIPAGSLTTALRGLGYTTG